MMETKFLGVFILGFIVLIESQVCPRPNTWECSNGACIWYDWRCDGDDHCDGSDEQNCANWTCSYTWWKCGDDKCIWKPDRCDGEMQCSDGSDERNCENWACVRSHWKCRDQTLCIPLHSRCDGTDQCADSSDEQHCDTSVVESLMLDGHNDTITVDGDGHKTLNLTCRVSGRVKGYVTLKKESDIFGNVTFRDYDLYYQKVGAWTYDTVMTLSDVTCDDMGRYTCTVRNVMGGTDSKTIQLNVTCAGMKYGGELTCPKEWEIGQNVKLTLTLDRSKWPSICRTDPDRREAWFEVTRLKDPGRQSIMCTIVNITSPGAFTPGTIGCGCVSETKWHYTLELNFVMNSSLFGNWSVDTHCLRTDSSKPLKFHVAPECNVRPGCENKTYGERCQESCGQCADGQTCNASTGHCPACLDGWLPPLCNEGNPLKFGRQDGSMVFEDYTNKSQSKTPNSFRDIDVDTHCLRTDSSKPLKCHVAPECNVRPGCENKTYGERCQESCGQCADDQTCNASTGHCPACLDGWLPPLCNEEEQAEKQAEEPLTTVVKLAVSVGVGGSAGGAICAWLYQAWVIFDNLGWMPNILSGKKEEEEEEETEEDGTKKRKRSEEEDEESYDEDELSICALCFMCLFCGGCGLCATQGKKISKRVARRKQKVVKAEKSSDYGPVPTILVENCERQKPSISEQPGISTDSSLEMSHEADNETQSIPEQTADRQKFTEQYFTTANWLANPIKHQNQNKLPNWHKFYSKSSVVKIRPVEKMSSKGSETIGKNQQDSNMSLQQSGAQYDEQVNISKVLGDSGAKQKMSRVSQDSYSHDRSSGSLVLPEKQEWTTGNTHIADNSAGHSEHSGLFVGNMHSEMCMENSVDVELHSDAV